MSTIKELEKENKRLKKLLKEEKEAHAFTKERLTGSYDRNFSLKTAQDFAILAELPAEVKMRVFKDFIYHDFLYNFRRIFRFKYHN